MEVAVAKISNSRIGRGAVRIGLDALPFKLVDAVTKIKRDHPRISQVTADTSKRAVLLGCKLTSQLCSRLSSQTSEFQALTRRMAQEEATQLDIPEDLIPPIYTVKFPKAIGHFEGAYLPKFHLVIVNSNVYPDTASSD